MIKKKKTNARTQAPKKNGPSIIDKIREKRGEKKKRIGGYTKEEYAAAVDELVDDSEDDFFGRSSFTETQSTVLAVVKALVYIILIVTVSVALAVFALTCANDIFAFVKEEVVAEVTIPDYATTDEISEILYDAGVIEYPWLFRFYADLKGVDSNDYYNFVGGTYTVSSTMNYDNLMFSFIASSTVETIRITFPEGSTVDEIVEIFVENGCGSKEGFAEVMENYDFVSEYDFLAGIDMSERYYLLEGYLYPDTYDFYVGRSEDYYLCRLLDQFAKVCKDAELISVAENMGITLDELLIIASIVEKEAYYRNDIDKVSAVIWNRLNNAERFPNLECDSTIVYALSYLRGERVTELTAEDLKLDSPYNSYLYSGYTPSPICNPGYDAIACAIDPAEPESGENPYYYFVSDKAGNMYYASTLAEHEANIQKIKDLENQN